METDLNGFFYISRGSQAIAVAAEKTAKEIERFIHLKIGRTDGHGAGFCQYSLRYFCLLDPNSGTYGSQDSRLQCRTFMWVSGHSLQWQPFS